MKRIEWRYPYSRINEIGESHCSFVTFGKQPHMKNEFEQITQYKYMLGIDIIVARLYFTWLGKKK